jgi:hypothetical protein
MASLRMVLVVALVMAVGSAALALPAAQVELTTGNCSLITSNHGAAQELKDPAAGGGSGVTMSSGDGSRATPWVYAFTAGGGGLDVNTYTVGAYYDAVELGNTDGGTNFTLDMGGEDVYGTSGNISFSTAEDTTSWGGYGSGDIRIHNVGTVDVGAIDTHNAAHYENSGAVYIGQPAGPATGNVRIDSISTWDTQVRGAYVKIYGSGDVLIQDSPAGVAGDIDAHGPGGFNSSPVKQIVAVHSGDFVARDLLTYLKMTNASGNTFGNYADVGGVLLDGGSAGDATIRDIDTSIDIRNTSGNVEVGFKYWDRAGYVEILDYQNVTIRNIDTHHATGSADATADGGNVDITGITSDITIQGTLDLSVIGFTAAQDPGALTLQCGGTITLEQGLDLSKVLYASFDSGPTTTYIYGVIVGSDGNVVDETNIDNLRAEAGDLVYYDPILNPGLGGLDYDLADLSGTAGAGGTLTMMVGPVAEPGSALLILFGAAGLVRKRRRA